MDRTNKGRAVGIHNTSIVVKCNGVEEHFAAEEIAAMVLSKILQASFHFNDSQRKATIDVGTSQGALAYDLDKRADCVEGTNTFILDLDREDFDNRMVNYLVDMFFPTGDVRRPWISRNTTTPVKKKIEYRTYKDNQQAVSIKAFEGASDNNLLGSFTLSGFPSAPCGHLFNICFAIDENDVLTVSAEDKTTRNRNKNKITITKEKGMLSTKEIKRMIQEGKRFQVEDEKFHRKAEAKNDLEKYVFEVRNYLTEAQSLLHGRDKRSKRCSREMETIISAIGEAQSLLHGHNQQDEAELFLDCLKKLKTSKRNMSDRSISHINKMKRGCPSHKQPLEYISSGAPHICSGCCELGFGHSYRCKECNYTLDDECADPVSNATHPFFTKSKFKFYKTAPGHGTRYCDACGKEVLGFVYHCAKTGFDLHPCCLKLKGSISVEQVHGKLELSQKVPSKCGYCEHKKVGNGVKGWSYVSSHDKKCCYHVFCVKEWTLENWKRGRFSQENTSSIGTSSRTDREHDQLAVRSIKMARSGGSSSSPGKIMKIAVTVFKVIFSAICGNPVSGVAAIVEALAG